MIKRQYESDDLILAGRNAVSEALKSGRSIDRVFLKKGGLDGPLRAIAATAREQGVVTREVEREKLDEMAPGKHQGVVAVCPAHAYADVCDILRLAEERNEPPFVIVLDGVADPRNLGAIIRTAECCGAHGVIIAKRRAVGLTGVVAKTAAGALEYVPVARVTNIPNVIDDLKKKGLWIVCADMDGQPHFEADLSGAVALVIGGEGSGVGRLVREKSDFRLSVPMFGRIGSLNASVAAGVIMYEIVRNRRFTGSF